MRCSNRRWRAAVALALGGAPLVAQLLLNILRKEFGSDLLAGISIVTSVILGEYLAGTLVVLMLFAGVTIFLTSHILEIVERRGSPAGQRALPLE